MFCVRGWVWRLWAASCRVSCCCEGWLLVAWTLWASTVHRGPLFLALAAASRVVLFHRLTCNSVSGVHLTKLIFLDHLYFLWISFPFIRTRNSLLHFFRMIQSLHSKIFFQWFRKLFIINYFPIWLLSCLSKTGDNFLISRCGEWTVTVFLYVWSLHEVAVWFPWKSWDGTWSLLSVSWILHSCTSEIVLKCMSAGSCNWSIASYSQALVKFYDRLCKKFSICQSSFWLLLVSVGVFFFYFIQVASLPFTKIITLRSFCWTVFNLTLHLQMYMVRDLPKLLFNVRCYLQCDSTAKIWSSVEGRI